MSQIDWIKWIETPGFPPINNDYSNKYEKEVENYYKLFINNNLPDNFKEIFINWYSSVQSYFLVLVNKNSTMLDDIQSDWLTNRLNLKEGYNIIHKLKDNIFILLFIK